MVWGCDSCDLEDSSYAAFVDHLNIYNHYQECSTCKRDFINNDSLRAHCIAQGHYFECPNCSGWSTSKGELRSHRSEAHGINHKCSTCKKEFFERKDLLQHHTSKGHGNSRRSGKPQHHSLISSTPKPAATPKTASPTSTPSPAEQYQCPLCIVNFDTVELAAVHTVVKHYMHQCSTCAGSFPDEATLNQHRRTIYLLECAFNSCSATFENFVDYQKHQMSDHESSPTIKCQQCQAYFETSRHRDEHIVEAHQLSCPHCDQNYQTLGFLLAHIKNFHEHKCEAADCHATFAELAHLKEHEFLHKAATADSQVHFAQAVQTCVVPPVLPCVMPMTSATASESSTSKAKVEGQNDFQQMLRAFMNRNHENKKSNASYDWFSNDA
ncbi:hypothetical protein BJ875DRAFT_240136 [Amylocarpus encephaloides]|uniref:C2H2-type domain-containing protein n=1 Tax=Amylocarpus encephaloides TaxID=45428 RepID=A0A9P8C006_9HELO|nr:hypothetical protein BJ875DRAFT_240136 [Amylocarpus encephaloides]